jgi:VWFA-related protein
MTRLLFIALLCAGFVASDFVGHGTAASQRAQTIRSAAAAVVVDAVVRDSNGKPVTNLGEKDFELLEDGIQQEIGDVTVVMPGSTEPPNAAAVAAHDVLISGTRSGRSPAPPAGPSFLAIVFDRLTPEARALAYKGAVTYLDTMHANDYAGIFLSDLTLTTVQPYTNDREKLSIALRELASRATSVFDRTATRDIGESATSGDAHPSVPVVASAESGGRPVDNRKAFAGEVIGLQLATQHSWEAMAGNQQGYATTNALLAITTALGSLRGRKSVVFFAEGLAIPDAVLPHFRSVVTNANRGNVSVYTIDAAGLRVHSKDAEIGREVRSMGAAGLTVNPDGSNQSGLGTMEHNENVLRQNPRTSLTLLAQQTGGFLVENTNDLAAAFRQVDSDRRFHYLLTYTPKNSDFDGKWRSIVVRVPNRRVSIRTRAGYLAADAPATLPLLAYEGPGLAALRQSPAPVNLPLRATALVFPGESQSRVVVLAATNADALRFDRDAKTRTYRTDFNVLARIVDAGGEVIRQSSQPYRLSGPMGQIDQAQQGAVLFFRQPTLEPGAYSLEVAVHDALASRSGVRRMTFIVPEVARQFVQVSSLVLVARAERVPPEERSQSNPLYVRDMLIYPNLGESIRKSRDDAVTFFVEVKTPSVSSPTAIMEVLRDGSRLSQAPVSLPDADESGRIRYIAKVPVDALPPGRYALRLTVTQGERREVRQAAFELIE